jgi:hypothetical protein
MRGLLNDILDNGKLDEAVVVILEALALAESIEAKSKQQRAYELLAAINPYL